MYGRTTLDEIVAMVRDRAGALGAEIDAFQSNEEGALVTRIGEAAGRCDGILFNPAAYTHTSVALRDALKACGLPCVEIHLSNTYAREEFRHRSLTAGVCLGVVMGFGPYGYLMALDALVRHVRARAGEHGGEGKGSPAAAR